MPKIFEVNRNATKAMEKEYGFLALADTKLNTFLEKDDSSAMHNIHNWQDQMDFVERVLRNLEHMALKHSFPEENREEIKTIYVDRKERYDAAVLTFQVGTTNM